MVTLVLVAVMQHWMRGIQTGGWGGIPLGDAKRRPRPMWPRPKPILVKRLKFIINLVGRVKLEERYRLFFVGQKRIPFTATLELMGKVNPRSTMEDARLLLQLQMLEYMEET